jgi:hypothetical protein
MSEVPDTYGFIALFALLQSCISHSHWWLLSAELSSLGGHSAWPVDGVTNNLTANCPP